MELTGYEKEGYGQERGKHMEIKDRRDELLLMVAVSGELPAGWSGYAVGSDSYAAVLVTRLKQEGELNVRRKDGIKGYLLRARAKRYLLEAYGEDVASYLSGAVATNHVKSEPEKRLRLHRMSMVWIFFHRAGIRIFKSEKPELFPVSHPTPFKPVQEPERGWGFYYGTAEWKMETDKEIKGSRACGILAASRLYVVYNTMDSLMKWSPKTERNVRSRIELRIRRIRKEELGGAVIMGNEMQMGKRLLESDGGLKGTLFRLDDVYESVYYVPFLEEAVLQLRLLCDRDAWKRFDLFLRRALKQVNCGSPSLEAGTDREGKRVYFCYLFELWQIRRILRQPLYGGGRIFCFTYQAQVLRELFPDTYAIEAIQPEKALQYLGWNHEKEEQRHGGNPIPDRK